MHSNNHKTIKPLFIAIIILSLIAISLGFYFVSWSKGGKGAGLYSRDWTPEAIFAYWNPKDFYQSPQSVSGTFTSTQCLECHRSVTPGIVNDWKNSRHAKADKVVFCNDCHGNEHTKLHMPSPQVCGGCHTQQHQQFEDEKRYGFPSHALAMERALDAKHFVDKPKAEVSACLQCHSVATKCDSCHSRHKFSAAEARRPEACITCHSGPPHPDDVSYFNSAHGQLYLADGNNWDWSKPLTKGNYPAPTCAYCHMREGKHQVADKSIWKFGLKQVNPLSASNSIKRQQWVELCSDCHQADWAAEQLSALDHERKRAWKKLYKAESIIKKLRSNNLLYPSIQQRPPYPGDTAQSLFQRERIGFFDGQASAFYNVSPIERDYFEMWYFDNLTAYKGAAHGDASLVTKGHQRMDKSLLNIQLNAKKIESLPPRKPLKGKHSNLWLEGDYTDYNREHN